MALPDNTDQQVQALGAENPMPVAYNAAPSPLAANAAPAPQFNVDQQSLNLSGMPNIAQGARTPITSPGGGNLVKNPTISQETNKIPAAAGAIVGALLARKLAGSGTTGGTTGGTSGGNTNVTGNVNVGGNTNAGGTNSGGTNTGGTNTGGTGSTVSVQLPAGTTQAQVDAQYGTTNGQSNYVIAGVDPGTGKVIAQPNYNIGPNFGGNTSTQGTTGTGTNQNAGGPNPNLPIDPNTGTPTGTTDLGNSFYQDTYGNIYDASGNLIYTSPNWTAGQSDPTQGGGGYDPSTDTSATDNYFQDDAGNIYDSGGNLLYAFQNDYYYEPSTGSYFDYNFDPVSSSFDATTDYYGYSPDYTGDVSIGDIIYEKNGGLATPLYKRGGQVRGYASGDLVTAASESAGNATPTETPTTTSTPTSTGALGSIANAGSSALNSIGSFIQNNPTISGAALGAVVSQLLNSSASPENVNKGVDMSALAQIAPRTTNFGMGPAKYVPYSEYGTPTSQNNYSELFQNLGVSPFNMGPPQGQQPATSPTGGLAPNFAQGDNQQGQMPINQTPDTAQPQYFEDADGNVYDGSGNLVYEASSGQMMEGGYGESAAPTAVSGSAGSQPGMSPLQMGGDTSQLAVSNQTLPYYSYGSPVNPADVLKSKGGGLAKMAGGGMMQPNVNVPVSDKFHPNIPTVEGRNDYRKGSYVEGAGDGQSDDIPAMLADGEYVIDAETVAQLGNGSNKAGAKVLDSFRQNIRAHKRGADINKIPPKAKSPLAYLKGAK